MPSDQDRIVAQEARMNRLETIVEKLLVNMTSSSALVDQRMSMNALLQQLHLSPGTYAANAGAAALREQAGPEVEAIRAALRSGDKLKAIKLYRSLFGGDMKEAQEALDAM